MERKRCWFEQIVAAVRQHELGVSPADIDTHFAHVIPDSLGVASGFLHSQRTLWLGLQAAPILFVSSPHHRHVPHHRHAQGADRIRTKQQHTRRAAPRCAHAKYPMNHNKAG